MRKRSIKKRRQAAKSFLHVENESAGQLLSLEEQEKASLKRIMAEMGHHSGRKGRARAGKSAPRKS